MLRVLILAGLSAIVLAACAAAMAQVPDLITYQGALSSDSGNPANGRFAMSFAMYGRKTGGVPKWSQSLNVPVRDGVFTVLLGGSAAPLPVGLAGCRYLEVSVGGTPLLPRQRLTSVLYALEAANSARLEGLSAADLRDASKLTGTLREARLPQNAIDTGEIQDESIQDRDLGPESVTAAKIARGAVTRAKIRGSAVTGAKVANGSLTGLDLAPDAVTTDKIANGTITGADILFGAELTGSSAATGLRLINTQTTGVSQGLYARSDGSSSVPGQGAAVYGYVGGGGASTGVYGATGAGDSSAGIYGYSNNQAGTAIIAHNAFGTGKALLVKSGDAVFQDDVSVTASRGGGAAVLDVVNTGTDAGTVGVRGTTDGIGGAGVYGYASHLGGETYGIHGYSRGQKGTGVYGYASTSSATGRGVHGKASGGTGVHGEGGLVGVRGETSRAGGYGVYGLGLADSGNSWGVSAYVKSPEGHALHGYAADANAHGLYIEQGKAYFEDPAIMNDSLEVYGPAKFYGGHGDLAENYRAENVEAGDVVVIGADGRLTKCTKERDTAVAGIVSTEPSMKLHGRVGDGEGVAPLALAGRVLCKVHAKQHPIEAGDLLTTSDIPGHAMKALRPRRCTGAIIGKALESLDSGTGRIQVLVTLR